MSRRSQGLAAPCLLASAAWSIAQAEKHYGHGVTDTEIPLGQTMPYSGSTSVYGTVGQAQLAFFRVINEHAGVNGRKIKLLSLDDGFSPPRTAEQVRKLVEQDQVEQCGDFLVVECCLHRAANTQVGRTASGGARGGRTAPSGSRLAPRDFCDDFSSASRFTVPPVPRLRNALLNAVGLALQGIYCKIPQYADLRGAGATSS